MTTVAGELRALFPTLAVTMLLPVPLLNFVGDGAGRAFAFAYLSLGCALLAGECFRPEAAGAAPDRRAAWCAKMGALAIAMALSALTLCACYWAVTGRPDGSVAGPAVSAVVPALGMVPCLTMLVGHPYAAVGLTALILAGVKLAGGVVVRLAYGPTAQADGRMAMSWDDPNLLVWFCLAGGLLASVALGVCGFRLASPPGEAAAAWPTDPAGPGGGGPASDLQT